MFNVRIWHFFYIRFSVFLLMWSFFKAKLALLFYRIIFFFKRNLLNFIKLIRRFLLIFFYYTLKRQSRLQVCQLALSKINLKIIFQLQKCHLKYQVNVMGNIWILFWITLCLIPRRSGFIKVIHGPKIILSKTLFW